MSAVNERFERAQHFGFTAAQPPAETFTPRAGSHNDGPAHGMVLGGIGAPALSRDLDGRFVRWHLEPGAHVLTHVPQAQLRVHWRDTMGNHAAQLCREDVDEYRVAGLFPLWHERFAAAHMPFDVLLTCFSPVLAQDTATASLPVLCFDVHIEPKDEPVPAIDIALFWPNLNGWRASPVTTADRGDQPWPGHWHARNRNRPGASEGCVVQEKAPDLRGPMANQGQVCVSAHTPLASCSRHVQHKADQNATGVPEHQQPYTFAAVQHTFDTTGRLDTDDGSWSAHWHEPIASAVATHHTQVGNGCHARFVVAFDWPDVVFGSGRTWRRGHAGFADAEAIATHAQHNADDWLTRIDAWHEERTAALTQAGWPDHVAGCVLNETGLVTSLGTVLVHGTSPGHEPEGPLRSKQHFGLLEGFDTGYFYLNTSDLWHYAFPAVTRNWPELADVLFDDLHDALEGTDSASRPIYRQNEHRPLLVAGRLPHDMGAVHEDPFVLLNGYSMRDDPNTWRDANPAFVLSTFVHNKLLGRTISERSLATLHRAAAVVATDAGDTGVARHDEFGDSTWDNLGLRGWSTYAAALVAGMWSVLDERSRLDDALGVLESLWDGDRYRACSEGKYANAVMPDSLLGAFYADLAGAAFLPQERVTRHLRTAYETAHLGYHGGRYGPLLIAEPGMPQYSMDGGEQLQANEVLLGPSWMFTAMLYRYGLHKEAVDVATSLRDVLYGATGLQFRSPAAVDAEGHFRAPLNMRPLAVWWLEIVATGQSTRLSAE